MANAGRSRYRLAVINTNALIGAVIVALSVGCSSEKPDGAASRDGSPPKPAAVDAAPPSPAIDAAPQPTTPDAAVEPAIPDESPAAAALVDRVLDKWASAFYMAKGQWRSGSCAKGLREMNLMLEKGLPERDALAALLAKPGAVSPERLAMARDNPRSNNKDRNFYQTFEKSNAFPCPRVRKAFDAFVKPLNKAWGDRASPPPWAPPKNN